MVSCVIMHSQNGVINVYCLSINFVTCLYFRTCSSVLPAWILLYFYSLFHSNRESRLSVCTIQCSKSKLVMHQVLVLFLLKEAVIPLQISAWILIDWPTWRNAWYTPVFCALVLVSFFMRILFIYTVQLFVGKYQSSYWDIWECNSGCHAKAEHWSTTGPVH